MAARPAIDPRIQDLPSTTFFGKRLTRRQISDVQEMVQACSGLSRTELALTVCEHLHWQAGSGASRVRLATRFLEQLAEHGIVSLPAKRPRPRGPDRAVALTERTAPQPPRAPSTKRMPLPSAGGVAAGGTSPGGGVSLLRPNSNPCRVASCACKSASRSCDSRKARWLRSSSRCSF